MSDVDGRKFLQLLTDAIYAHDGDEMLCRGRIERRTSYQMRAESVRYMLGDSRLQAMGCLSCWLNVTDSCREMFAALTREVTGGRD